MQLDKLVIPTNPKTSWQCFDLGCRVAIAHYYTLFFTYLFVSLPFFLIGFLIDPVFVLLIFWLFKPWYERALLYILSRAVFDTQVSIKEAIKAWPSQIKPLWFSSVTFRRLAPSRSFDMAVTQLEKLTGNRRSERLSVLHRTHDDNTFWLTLLCAHWEMFLFIGLFTLAQILMPQEFDSMNLYELYIEKNYAVFIFSLITIYIVAAIVAPFYVAGGFIAYLNRRIILEAWDIELSFKKWRANYLKNHVNDHFDDAPSEDINKQESNESDPIETDDDKHIEPEEKSDDTQSRINSHFIATCLLLLSAQLFISNPSLAQEQQNEELLMEGVVVVEEPVDNLEAESPERKLQTENAEAVKKDLKEIYNQKPFGGKKTVTRYRFRFADDDEEEEEFEYENTDDSWYSFFSGIGTLLASFIQVIFWGLFIAVFAYIIYRNWSTIEGLFSVGNTQVDDIPLPTFISKSFTEKLPNDVVLAVNEAISNGDFRRALSLLVRASLTKLSEQKEIRITKSMTENECLNVIKAASSLNIYQFMQMLMQQWMKMAWAHQLPSNDELLVLVESYENDFLSELYVNGEHPGQRDESL